MIWCGLVTEKNRKSDYAERRVNRVRYQKRIQEERETQQRMRDELEKVFRDSEDDYDDPLPKIS
jgi:hypothetical protein